MGKILLFMVLLPMLCFSPLSPAMPAAGLPDGGIIRFHVKAHSNDPHDQAIKNYLAGRLLQTFGPLWNGCQNSAQLHILLEKDKKAIQETACRILGEKDVHDPVGIEFAKGNFPARYYGDRFYPAGEYTSLTIEIGSGQGENWWCVLFPPLCFTVFPAPGGESLIKDREKEIVITHRPAPGPDLREAATPPPEKEGGKWRFWCIDFLAKVFSR